MSQAEMAQFLSVPTPTYGTWEADRAKPQWMVQEVVARTIAERWPSVSMAWMLGDLMLNLVSNEAGESDGQQRTKLLRVPLLLAEYERIREAADAQNVSMSELVLMLIRRSAPGLI